MVSSNLSWGTSSSIRTRPRYCVDAGAYDGIVGSNTRALFLSGWSGLVIEPDPRTFVRWAALYMNRPDVRCIRKALSNKVGVGHMLYSEGPPGTRPEDQWKYAQVNTLSSQFSQEYEHNYNYRYRSSCITITTLTQLLKEVHVDGGIGFMSIDCEGEDLATI
jgi:FkbM family methyltransferase